MTREEIVIHLANVTTKEYAWSLHCGAVVFLVSARIHRKHWFHLLFCGAVLILIAIGGYSSAQVLIPTVPQNNPVSGDLILFQQILLLAYGAVGAGLVTVGLTMDSQKAVD